MTDAIFVALGLVILIFAGDALVRGAVNLALRLGIPALLVSLTIVSFGTSAPELVVGVDAVIEGAPGIAIGNVIGSNTANVLLVLGIPALIAGISAGRPEIAKSYVVMLLATAWFIAVCFFGPLTWVHGLLLLLPLAVILFDQGREAMAHRQNGGSEPVEGADPKMRGHMIAFYLIAGLIGLPLGAHWLVDGASNIATRMGISQTVIGLTLVAVGTSLPELATTVVAALRRHTEVALGNVIGSNLFNLLAIIGAASLFGTIPVSDQVLRFDLWVMFAASVALVPFVLMKIDMTRPVGAVLSALYVAYLVIVFMQP